MTQQRAIGLGMSDDEMSRHDFADAVDARLAAAWAEYEASQRARAARSAQRVSFISYARSAMAGAWAAWVRPVFLSARDRRAPSSDLRHAIDRYLDGDTPNEDILSILESPLVERQLAAFDRLDALALAEQRRYWRAGSITRLASWASVLIAPFLLLSMEGQLPSGWDVGTNVAHIATVGLTAVTILVTLLRRPVGRWKRARYRAEKARAEVFRLMIQECSNARELKQALACFMVAHFDWQMQFYRKRIAELPRRVDADRRALALSRLAQVTLAIGSLAVGLSASFAAGMNAVVPPGEWAIGGTRIWAFNGAAFSLLAFAGARSLSRDLTSTRALSPANAYNRALYRWAEAELLRLSGDLGNVQEAAARGDRKTVLEFRDRVQYVLDAENMIWALEQDQEQEAAQAGRASPAELSPSASLIRS